MHQDTVLDFLLLNFNNFDESEILPSLSNCKLVLSDKIDVEKKSLFSSNGFKESIAEEIFSILSWEQASIEKLLKEG